MNLSRLTMLDVMVHELSHGWNFVLAARCAAPILNLDHAYKRPHTEGMALHRELEFYVSAADLMTKSKSNSRGASSSRSLRAKHCGPREGDSWSKV